MAGIRTTNLERQFSIDELIGNITDEGVEKTARIPLSALVNVFAGTGPFVLGNTVYAATFATLPAPASATQGAVVLNDPDPTKNGFYSANGSAWEGPRPFDSSIAKVVLSGPANAQTGLLQLGANPAGVVAFFAMVGTENTGPLTLSINGGPSRDVVNAAGNPVASGEWTGAVLFYLNSDGDYQLLLDAGAVASAAQSATNSSASALSAATDADRAETAAAGVEFPVSYAPQTLTSPQQTQARDNLGLPAIIAGIENKISPAHLVTHFDLAKTLVGDGTTNDTAAFAAALATMETLGITKIISSVPTKRFRIVNQTLTSTKNRLDFDMNGAAFVGDYNVANANDHTTIFTVTQSSLKVTFRNAEIDGSSAGGVSGIGGNPVILFNGPEAVEFIGCTFRRMSNRTAGPFTSVFTTPWRGQIMLTNTRRATFEGCTFYGGLGEVLEVVSPSTNANNWTRLTVSRCHFTKERETQPGVYNSSSSIVVYNAAKGSIIQDCTFGQHIKSAINVFAPIAVERCYFAGVSDSNAIDFNEAGSFNIDAYVVRNCKIENVTNGYAIRGSGRNVIIENIEINRCQNGIYVEPWSGVTNTVFDNVGTQRLRTMYNVWIRNIISNGNNVPDGTGAAVENSLIKIKGASSSLPAIVYVSGLGVNNHPTSDIPTGGFNPELGIDCQDCYLFLEGGLYQHGTEHLIRMTGTAAFSARDCAFQVGSATIAAVRFHNATVKNILFDSCYAIGSLPSGAFHVQVSGSSSISGKAYFRASQDISSRSGIAAGSIVDQ